MNSVDPARIEQLFTEALSHANHTERHRFLSDACGQDTVLWNSVWDRLRSHFISAAGSHGSHGPEDEKPGDVLGECHLLQIVGEGLSSVVWMAERHTPQTICVAVKIVNTGANDFLMRHAAVKPLLVLLDHPSIARVHGSGMTNGGRPFLVTDMVSGVPITQFCDDQKLSLSARVRLFLQVCGVIHHAHQKGMSHGDLKPANVLVQWNGEGQPTITITDFGFSQSMGPEVLTPEGRLRTPGAYLAPELAGTTKVSEKGDILALGTLLFELITGRLPFLIPTLVRNVEEMRKAVRETAPMQASECLKALPKAQLSGIALGRRTDPARLLNLTETYFDGILMRTMQKQPHARLHSVQVLAEALCDYLQVAEEEEEHVAAVESTVGSFLLRHRSLLATAAALVLLLTAVSVVGGWLWLREKPQDSAPVAKNKSATHSLTAPFMEGMFACLTPERVKGHDTTLLKGMLDEAAGRLNTLKDHPEAGAQMQETIGLTYLAMAQNAPAQKQLQGALDKRMEVLGREHPDTLRSMREMAVVFKEQGRHPEAASLLRRTLEVQRRVLGPEHPDTFITITVLAAVCEAQDQPVESEKLFTQLWKVQKRVLGPNHLDTLSTLGGLACLVSRQGRHAEAAELQKEHLNLTRKAYGERHPHTLASMTMMAAAYESGGQPSEAEKLYTSTMEIMRETLGTGHPDTLTQMDKVALLQRHQGRPREALKLHQAAMESRRRTLGAQHPSTLLTMRHMAEDLEADDQKQAAETVQENVLEVLRIACGPEHADTLAQTESVADTYERHGRTADAVALRKLVLQVRRHTLGTNHPKTLSSMAHLARTLSMTGRKAEAEALQAEALASMQAALGPGDPDTLAQMHRLALMQQRHGHEPQAEETWRQKLQIQQKALGMDHPDTLHTMHCLAEACRLQGRLPEAEQIYQEVLKMERSKPQPDGPRLADCAERLGHFWLLTKRPSDAERLLKECLALRQKHLPKDWKRFCAESMLGDALLALRQMPEAGSMLRSGYEGMNTRLATIPKEEHFHIRDAIERMARFVESTEGTAAAVEWRHKLAEFDQYVQLAGN